MRYHNIERVSLVNGEGVRTVLWVAGCSHHCKGCQNPITWNPDDGLLWDSKAKEELFANISQDWCDGLTLSGGDPMYIGNRGTITELCREYKERFQKSIWMYTGYTFAEISREPVLDYVDVVVDGEYVEDLADVHYMWAGSTNQRIWKKENGCWVLREQEWEVMMNGQTDRKCCGMD